MTSPRARRTPSVIVVAACAAALALAGCGGGSSSTSSSSSSSAAAATTAASASAQVSSSAGELTSVTSSTTAQSISPGAQAYAAKLVPLAEVWQKAAQSYATAVGGAGTDNLGLIASSSDKFARQTVEFADGIAALTPPAGAEKAQADLVAAVRALGSDVKELQSAAQNHDLATAKDAQQRVGPDGRAVSAAVVALAAAAQRSSG